MSIVIDGVQLTIRSETRSYKKLIKLVRAIADTYWRSASQTIASIYHDDRSGCFEVDLADDLEHMAPLFAAEIRDIFRDQCGYNRLIIRDTGNVLIDDGPGSRQPEQTIRRNPRSAGSQARQSERGRQSRSAMKEDKEAAQRLVESDARNLARLVKASDGKVFTNDQLIRGEVPEAGLCHLTIGTRANLTNREADRAAEAWRAVRARSPEAIINIMILGYDDDPRELWEFPKVCRYVRRWARSAGIDAPDAVVALPVTGLLLAGLLAACGVFGEEMRAIALQNRTKTLPV